LKISLIRIGNSRGIRLPAPLIKKFGFDGVILLEEEGDRLVLKTLKRGKAEKLPWSETACEMASTREDSSDWEPSEKDGLQEIPLESSDQRKSQPSSAMTSIGAASIRLRKGKRRKCALV
jgi:antitoxin component of MazEF toxin-antitoxin module